MAKGSDIELEEIERWLATVDDEPSEVASRAYSQAKLSHVGGERPNWCRIEWHNLNSKYREFLVSIARAGMEHGKPKS